MKGTRIVFDSPVKDLSSALTVCRVSYLNTEADTGAAFAELLTSYLPGTRQDYGFVFPAIRVSDSGRPRPSTTYSDCFDVSRALEGWGPADAAGGKARAAGPAVLVHREWSKQDICNVGSLHTGNFLMGGAIWLRASVTTCAETRQQAITLISICGLTGKRADGSSFHGVHTGYADLLAAFVQRSKPPAVPDWLK